MDDEKQRELTADRAKSLLEYDKDSGLFRWRRYRSGLAPPGSLAGCLTTNGYVQVRIDRKGYMAHRLAWLVSYGVWPEHEIDHINGIKTDNRLCNLRDIPRDHNQQNQTLPQSSNRHSKRIGVCWVESRKKWLASIGVNGKSKFLGHYDCEQSAYDAYIAAKRELHPGGML